MTLHAKFEVKGRDNLILNVVFNNIYLFSMITYDQSNTLLIL